MHDLSDAYPLAEIVPEGAEEKAQEMRELMNSDRDEYEIATLVRSFDAGDLEMQLGAWLFLSTSERAAWRKFRALV